MRMEWLVAHQATRRCPRNLGSFGQDGDRGLKFFEGGERGGAQFNFEIEGFFMGVELGCLFEIQLERRGFETSWFGEVGGEGFKRLQHLDTSGAPF